MGKLIVAGIGPGAANYVIPEVDHWVQQARLLVGGRRALELFRDFKGRILQVTKDYQDLFPEIAMHLSKGQTVVVLVSGDPGIFSLMSNIKNEFPNAILVVPGISSIQMAAARLQTTWDDATILSIHHKLPENLLLELNSKEKIFILTGPIYDPVYLLDCLVKQGILDCRIAICADLSSPDEEVISIDLSNLSIQEIETLKLALTRFKKRSVVFYFERSVGHHPELVYSGLGDQQFQRGTVPMTKEEIRAISLSKLRIQPDSIVYDVGSGTGSIAVQAAMFAYRGVGYAMDHKPEAIKLTRSNALQFGLKNVVSIEGKAPGCFPIQKADAIFLGGTGGYLQSLFKAALEQLNPQGRIVLNAVSIDTVTQMWDLIGQHPELEIEVIQAQIATAEPLGQTRIWKGRNPVTIFTLERK